MASYSEQNDRIILSFLDIRLLVALLAGSMNAYELARQCETDMPGSNVSTANAYRAFDKLEALLLVKSKESHSSDARQRRTYHLTSLGKLVAQDRVTALEKMIEAAKTRLAKKK